MLFVVIHITKHCIVVHFCQSKHVFIPVAKQLSRWLHQKLNVVQLQKKQHVHEKEMQRQKLQQEKDLQDEELLADKLQEKLQNEELLADKLQEKLQDEELLADELQEKLQEDLLHEEGVVNLPSFFLNNRYQWQNSPEITSLNMNPSLHGHNYQRSLLLKFAFERMS